MPLVEWGSVAVLALYALVQWRRGALGGFAREVALLCAAAWLAEDLCIRLYDFYGYAPGWHLRLDRVPLLIGVIWPVVILSAREVAQALFGESRWLPLQAGALICFDAALVEPVAVRAGLWSWSEQCLLGVPLIGIAGWGVFGACCLWLLRGKRPWLVLTAPLLANGALAALWWTAFRWGPRTELPFPLALFPAALGAGLLLYLTCRRTLSIDILAPRAAAALLFITLAALHGDRAIWLQAALIAVPWLWLLRPGNAGQRLGGKLA